MKKRFFILLLLFIIPSVNAAYEYSSLHNGLQALYTFDNITNETLKDQIGNYDGIIHGVTTTNGIIGEAGLFNKAEKDYVMLPNNSFTNFNEFSICAWLRPFSEGQDRTAFQIYSTPGDWNQYKFGVNYYGSAFMAYYAFSQVIGRDICYTAMTYASNTVIFHDYFFVCSVLDSTGNNATLWVNGELRASHDFTNYWNPEERIYWGEFIYPTRVNIGKDPYYETHGDNSDYWDGEIDEMAIWNRPLTQEEITTMYNDYQGINLMAETEASTYDETPSTSTSETPGLMEITMRNLIPILCYLAAIFIIFEIINTFLHTNDEWKNGLFIFFGIIIIITIGVSFLQYGIEKMNGQSCAAPSFELSGDYGLVTENALIIKGREKMDELMVSGTGIFTAAVCDENNNCYDFQFHYTNQCLTLITHENI